VVIHQWAEARSCVARTTAEHTETIARLELLGRTLITCSFDGQIIVW
jgi:hypothetical protein